MKASKMATPVAVGAAAGVAAKAIENGRYQIGNNRGFINGWIGAEHIYGKCVKVEA